MHGAWLDGLLRALSPPAQRSCAGMARVEAPSRAPLNALYPVVSVSPVAKSSVISCGSKVSALRTQAFRGSAGRASLRSPFAPPGRLHLRRAGFEAS